jgi:hypothetical protein
MCYSGSLNRQNVLCPPQEAPLDLITISNMSRHHDHTTARAGRWSESLAVTSDAFKYVVEA